MRTNTKYRSYRRFRRNLKTTLALLLTLERVWFVFKVRLLLSLGLRHRAQFYPGTLRKKAVSWVFTHSFHRVFLVLDLQ